MTAQTLTIKRISTISILLALALTAAYPALAIDATTAATNRKELAQERVDSRKENMQTRITDTREKMASREAALKTKLNAFKDQRKAQITERVNINLNRINQNQTDQMQKHLSLMTTLLDKLQTRLNQITPEITIARANIATTSAAVTAQAQNDYTITVTTESKVRADATKTRNQLHADLKAVRDLVISAKQSVARAISQSQPAKEETTNGQQ